MVYISREELNEKSVIELRELCKKYNITGVSKERKSNIIDYIMNYYENCKSHTKESKKETVAINNDKKPGIISTNIYSVLNEDNTYKSIVSVSSGAASGNYMVVGKTTGYVKELYKEILNIDTTAEPIVNGEKVLNSYVLKSGDVLEFLKPAGVKG